MIEETNINNKPFIIGAGLGRTGTFSLKVALEQLNFGPCYHGFLVTVKDHSDYWYQVLTMKNKEKFDFEQIFKEYNSTTDFPAGHFWEDILKAYPNSKVILTVRDSAEDWYKSITETFLMVNLNDLQD